MVLLLLKIPLRPSASKNIKNSDRCCFLWSVLASRHPGSKDKSNRVSNYRQYFGEINIEGFDFTNSFRCSEYQKFEKLNNLSMNKSETYFFKIKTNGNII